MGIGVWRVRRIRSDRIPSGIHFDESSWRWLPAGALSDKKSVVAVRLSIGVDCSLARCCLELSIPADMTCFVEHHQIRRVGAGEIAEDVVRYRWITGELSWREPQPAELQRQLTGAK